VLASLFALSTTGSSSYSTGSASLGCFSYLHEIAGVDIVDAAVDRNVPCDERMLADSTYVLSHAWSLILNGEPFYELARACSMAMLRIRPHLTVELGGLSSILTGIVVGELAPLLFNLSSGLPPTSFGTIQSIPLLTPCSEKA
jgi:hypothetical protein